MVLVSSSEDGERETTTTTRDSSSSSTLNRLIAIANFLKLHQPLWRAHVVEFFQVVALALTHTHSELQACFPACMDFAAGRRRSSFIVQEWICFAGRRRRRRGRSSWCENVVFRRRNCGRKWIRGGWHACKLQQWRTGCSCPLELLRCTSISMGLYSVCLAVCLLLSFFFVKAWEVRDCCSFSFAMVIIVASVWKTLPKSCMHREGSVQQWDELQRHRDEEEYAPWELHWGYRIRVTVMFLSFFLLAYGFFFFSAVSPDVNQMLWKTSSCFLMGATDLVAWLSFCLICRMTGFHHWRSLCGQHIL